MCFSASASFTTAAVAGALGLASIARTENPRQLPLAATPLVFAFQQGIEGFLWMTLPIAPDPPATAGLALVFLFLAKVFWPLYAPCAAILSEPSSARRAIMYPCLAAGGIVSAIMLPELATRSHDAQIVADHIVYATEQRPSAFLVGAYFAATVIPLVASSRKFIMALGATILIGSVVAYAAYWEAFTSVWCFFAAAASGLILLHFEWERRRRAIASAA